MYKLFVYIALSKLHMKRLFLLLTTIIVSCHGNRPAKKIDSTDYRPKVIETKISIKADTVLTDFPDDSLSNGNVLEIGLFHSDEVPLNARQLKWFGLFCKNGKTYYLDTALIDIQKVKDEMVDEDGQQTGWQVKAKHTDSCLLLISGVENLSKHPITKLSLGKEVLLPGDEQVFAYNGIKYTLYATGDKKTTQSDGFVQLTNYRMFLKSEANGQVTNQILTANGNTEYGHLIKFVGDIDGDELPDLIIDTSGKENVGKTTLYLSKPASKGTLLKAIGMHIIVGC